MRLNNPAHLPDQRARSRAKIHRRESACLPHLRIHTTKRNTLLLPSASASTCASTDTRDNASTDTRTNRKTRASKNQNRKTHQREMSTREDIRLYCGINEHSWDHQPTAPGPYACIAPVYGKSRKTQETNGVTLPAHTSVLQDSGAFSDCNATRLDPGAALERMYRHSDRYHYDSQITHRASYDQLIDEQWDDNDIRHKIRWSELDATDAVRQTIEAARYLSLHY